MQQRDVDEMAPIDQATREKRITATKMPTRIQAHNRAAVFFGGD
jgi:hypothetical protein